MTSSTITALRWLAIASLLAAAHAVAQPQVLSTAGITVSAEHWTERGESDFAVRLALDTHVGDLLAFDLATSASLERSDGSRIAGTFTYRPESDSSHHRQGVLHFVTAPDTELTPPVTLVLRNVGVPEWRFVFEDLGAAPSAGPASPDATVDAEPNTPTDPSTDAGVVYVAVIADGAVAAIDTERFALAWTLVVSEGADARLPEAAMGLALSPDGRTLYAGDAATGELVVVDTAGRSIVARLALDHGVHAIDLAPDGRMLWVDGALEGFPWLSATSVIDTTTLAVVRRLTPALGAAAHLSFTPDGREVWAPSITTNLAWIWDASTGAVLDVVPLTSTALSTDSPEAERGLIGFNEIALAPDGRTAYAVGPEASVVYAVDVAGRAVTGTAKVGARAHGIAVRPDGREVWTANRGGSVTILDAATLTVLATLDLGAYANHVVFTSDGAYALVGRETDVAVVDVAQRTLVHAVEVGGAPHEFAAPRPVEATAAGGR